MKKKLVKAAKMLGISVIYVLIHIGIQFVLQGIYFLWNINVNGQSEADAMHSLLGGTYALNVIGSVISLWIYILIGHWRKRPFAEYINFRKITHTEVSMTACCAIGARMLVCVYQHFAEKSEILKQSIENASEIMPEVNSAAQMLVLLFSIAVAAPVFEELLFRGLVQRTLTEAFRPWLAIVLQAAMFGAAHGFIFQSGFAFAVGLILGIVYERTRSMWAVMLIHAVFNVSVIITPFEMNRASVIIFLVGGVLLVALSMFHLAFGPHGSGKRR